VVHHKGVAHKGPPQLKQATTVIKHQEERTEIQMDKNSSPKQGLTT